MRIYKTKLTIFIIFFMLTTTLPANSEQTMGNQVELLQIKNNFALTPFNSHANHEEQPLLTNVIPNGKFTQIDPDGSPSELDTWGSGYYNYTQNFQDEFRSGTTAYMVEAQGYQFSSSPQTSVFFSSPPYVYLNETLTFDYWSFMQNNPLTTDDSIYMRLRFINNTSGLNSYIHNYMSYDSISTNNSNNMYLENNSSSSVWHNYNLEISQIYQDYFGSITDTYFYSIRFYVYSPPQALTTTQLVLDDLSLINSTLYEYIPNGNFEGDTVFSNPGRSSPSSITIKTENGNKYANMTSSSNHLNSYSSADLGEYYGNSRDRVQLIENQTVFNFDYSYSDTVNGGSSQQSYLYLELRNSTYWVYLYWYLGYGDGFNLPGNFTGGSNYSYYYFNASSIGTKDSWVHEQIDVFSLASELNLTDFSLSYLDFAISISQNLNSSVTLLLDNLEILAPPIRDNGFENLQEATLSNPMPTWYTSGYGYPTYNRTTNSHEGNWALNITVSDDQFQGVYRNLYGFEVEKSYFTDFWFKLDERNSAVDNSYAYYNFQLEGNYYLYYVIAGETTSFSNSSNYVYYLIDDINVENEWINVVRNVWDDLDEAFGTKLWNITNFWMSSNTPTSSRLSILFDDSNFIQDTHGPTVDYLEILSPTFYNNDIDVQINVSDSLTTVNQVNLVYSTDVSWTSVVANMNSNSYFATIPMQDYGNTVEFYIETIDKYGNIAIDDNAGLFYKYLVGDNVSPIINIDQPLNNSVIIGIVTIEVDSVDAGSSLSYVEILIDGSVVTNRTDSPYTYEWDTRLEQNGNHTVTARSSDIENNIAVSDTLKLIISNDLSAPLISDILTVPAIPTENEEISFAVGITDDSTITSVKLFTKLDDGSWQTHDMTGFGSLYSTIIDPISTGSTLLYYIEATDEFDQTGSKGSETSPFEYGIPSEELEGIEAIQDSVQEIYENNELYVGMGSMVTLWVLVKLIKLRTKRKSKK